MDTIDKVKAFINIVTKFTSDIDLVSARYVVDAKSIVGVLSLDLKNPLQVRITGRGDGEEAIIERAIAQFAC